MNFNVILALVLSGGATIMTSAKAETPTKSPRMILTQGRMILAQGGYKVCLELAANSSRCFVGAPGQSCGSGWGDGGILYSTREQACEVARRTDGCRDGIISGC